MSEHQVTLSTAEMHALTAKLDSFGEGLTANERQLLGALLSNAMRAAADAEPEVSGFGFVPDASFQVMLPNPKSFGLLGDSLRLGSVKQLGLNATKTA